MYFDGNVTFKGVTSGDLGIIVSSMPKVIHSTVKTTEYDIPLRDGIQYSKFRNRTDAQVTVKFAIVEDSNSDYVDVLRATRQWLSGTGNLILDNNPDVYYVVKKVEITDETSYTLTSAEIEATFTIEPFEYLLTDTVIERTIAYNSDPITVEISNDGDLCRPIIMIKNNTQMLGKYGAKIKVDSGDYATIEYMAGTEPASIEAYCDSNLMYTYSVNNGVKSNSESHFSHNYEDLWIPNGTHTITIAKSSPSMIGNTSTKVEISLRKGYAL